MFRVLFWIFMVCYFAALAVYFKGRFGLFGADQDPTANAYLVPLGMPWGLFLDYAPVGLWGILIASLPLANLMVLKWLGEHA